MRGGNSALFGANAPGGLVNLISKTGGPVLGGSFRVQAGTDGLNRYDANVNGPLAEDWRFSIGGFYRYDDGIRDPGFPASRGGQLKANLTRFFDQGHFRLYAKYINDKNVFYLPVPVQTRITGDVSPEGTQVIELTSDFAPGFPSSGTLTTNDANFTRIPLPQGNGEFSLPLEDGIAQTGATLQAELSFNFANDWSIQNTMRVMNLNHENNAMPPGQPEPASAFVADLIAATPGAATGELTYVNDGSTFNTANDLIQQATIWHVERPVSNFSNQFLIRKRLVAGETTHNFSLGTYFGFYTADNLWMFNGVLTEIADAPRLLNLVLRDAGGTVIRERTENGFLNYLGLYVNGTGNATHFSVFAGDEIQLSDRLRIDLGVRVEEDEYEQNIENTTTFDLGGPSDADDAVGWGDRTFSRRNVDFFEWAASVGVNYLLTDQISLYARGSRGYKVPELDQYIFGDFPDTSRTLQQAEGGVKISSAMVGLSLVGYWAQVEDFPSQDVVIDPVTGLPVFVTVIAGKARTIGISAEAVVAPTPGLLLNSQVTLQDHEYLDFVEGGDTLDGNWIKRIPKVILNLGGSYSNTGFTIGGDWRYFGKRFSNNANSLELPQFGYVNARASYAFSGQGVTLSAAVLNLLDGAGLTEGDPRFDSSGVPTGLGTARPILPRRWIFGLRYDF